LKKRVYNLFRVYKGDTPYSKITVTARTEINHEPSIIMVHSELDSDVFENVLRFLGPADLIAMACVGQAFTLNLKEEVYKTDIMKWARATEMDNELDSIIGSAPEARILVGEEATFRGFSFSSACTFAAASGKLEILKLLRARSFPWSSACTALAAYAGHLETLVWSIENGCDCDEWTFDCAAAGEDMPCVSYLHQNGCPWDQETFQIAASLGSLEFLKYGNEHGCPWGRDTCVQAAVHNNIDCLKYAHENGCTWDVFTTACAALHGNMECLVYAMNNGCPADAFVCNSAIVGKHVDCLRYAHQHGCGWNFISSVRAVESGNLDCFKYLANNGCPYDARFCRTAAKNFEHFELAKWLNAETVI